MNNPFEQQKAIAGVRHIVLVGAGKGGVGKSTVATNLSMALVQTGAKVGLLDADIYGPSIPRMLGALNQRPEVDASRRIQPLVRFGLKLMSIGFLVEGDQAMIWRGPMLFKAIDQFLRDVEWGPLDYLIIDLPPGTGDVPLSLAQKLPVAGAIVVCTPQNVALADARKSIDMFEKLNIRLLGVVENMSDFWPPGLVEPMALFPKGDLDEYLRARQIEKLASVPFHPAIALASEAGIPYVESSSAGREWQAYQKLSEQVRAILR